MPIILLTEYTTLCNQSFLNENACSAYESFAKVQSNSIIVDSIIVENSKIVDNLAATKDLYLIKIHNSRNSKIVELFLERLREI